MLFSQKRRQTADTLRAFTQHGFLNARNGCICGTFSNVGFQICPQSVQLYDPNGCICHYMASKIFKMAPFFTEGRGVGSNAPNSLRPSSSLFDLTNITLNSKDSLS